MAIHGARAQTETFWATLSEDYFQHTSANAIAWQTRKVLETSPEQLPLVLVRRQSTRGGTEVFHYGRDQDGLFAITTAMLDQLGLDIAEARIETTTSGHTLNSYQVLEEDGTPITGHNREQEIISTLRQALTQQAPTKPTVSRRIPRQLKHFATPTQIEFLQDPGEQSTIMKLATSDRPGLLSKIGHAFADCDIWLHTAKIATIGAMAEDIFFITDNDNRPLTEPEQFEQLKQALLKLLDT